MPNHQNRPNILILMSDQHSKHVLGCYGDEVVRTPNLDRLAAAGMRFTNTYCPAPLCVPSRMAFMTSRTPTRNRVWDNGTVLSSGIPTWAHILGAAGYETSLIGRMHFVGSDQRHGFERRPIGEYSAGHPGVPEKGGPRWTRFPPVTCAQARETVEIAGTGTTTYQWFDEQVTEATLRFLAEKATDPGTRPFAAVSGFVLPHCPYIAPKPLFEYYYDRVDVPPLDEGLPLAMQRWRRLRGLTDPELPTERIRIARAAYFALCEYYDALLGRILTQLEATGLADNTLVIYTSDHGEMAGEHGCWWKSNYYEGSAGVPMIARLPGVVPEGAVCDAVCNLMDIGPTLGEIAGADMPRVDGHSLWPTLQGNHPADWVDETYSELADGRGGDPNFPSRMIRSGEWKLWVYADAQALPPALFNLAQDPDELHDLGTDPAHAARREELLAKVHTGWNPHEASAAAVESNQDREVLEAWGRAVLPECEDTLAVPPPEIEADVELL